MSAKIAKAKTAELNEDRLLDLLRGLPTYLFTEMVSKAGMPAVTARELCEEFKKLKES